MSVTVYFSTDFKPGTFHATLDGKDITTRFSPAPAPGNQSTANLPDDGCGFLGGESGTVSHVPPMNPPTYRDTKAKSAGPGSSVVVVPIPPGGGSGVGSGSGVPPPPDTLAIYWHRIKVDGDCKVMICKGDELVFLPPHLVGIPPKLPLTVGVKSYLQVEAWPPASVSIPVRVRPEMPTVRLNGSAAGAPVSTSVPPGSRSSPITVEGTFRGSQHKTWLCAAGTQRALVSGLIN